MSPSCAANPERQGLSSALAGEALRLAWTALTTEIHLPEGPGARLDDLEKRLPEVAFQMPFPDHPDGLEGSLDLLFEREGRIYVLVWKTNSLEGGGYGDRLASQSAAGSQTAVGPGGTASHQAAGNPGPGLSGPVYFFPDGTCSNVQIRLENEYHQTIGLSLRGLTGVVTVGEVQTTGGGS